MNSEMNTQMNINTNEELNIALPELTEMPTLTRAVNNPTFRERVSNEKYYLQSSGVFDKNGILVDSGFVMLKRYSDFEMVLMLNQKVVYPHAFEKWEHYGDTFYNTGEYKVVDLATSNVLSDWAYDVNSRVLFLKNTNNVDESKCNLCKKKLSKYCQESKCVVVLEPYEGDLVKDKYSVVLSQCLDEISLQNGKNNAKEYTEFLEDKIQEQDKIIGEVDDKMKEMAMEEIINAQVI